MAIAKFVLILFGYLPVETTSTDYSRPTAQQISENEFISPAITLNNIEVVSRVEIKYGALMQGSLSGSFTKDIFENDTARFELPISFVDELGIIYQFHIYDNQDNLILVTDTVFTYIDFLEEAQSPSIPNLRSGSTQSAYQLITVPYALDNASITSVFDELGVYDDTQWRLFEFINGNNREKRIGNLQRGKGYWFITRNNTNIQVGAGSTELPNDEPFTINLNTGWNLIGNPYPFAISWENVLHFRTSGGICAESYDYRINMVIIRLGFSKIINKVRTIRDDMFVRGQGNMREGFIFNHFSSISQILYKIVYTKCIPI